MPFDPIAVGNSLFTVGEKEIRLGNKLKHSATELRVVAGTFNEDGRVDRALGAIEAGARSVRTLLTPVAAALHTIAEGLNSISVPAVDFDTRTVDFGPVGTIRLVTGISVSSRRPFQAIGTSVETAADNIDTIRVSLREIADGAKDLGDQLPNVKTHITAGADDLEQGGVAMVEAGNLTKEIAMLFG